MIKGKLTKETQKEVKVLEELFDKYWQIEVNAFARCMRLEREAENNSKNWTITEKVDNAIDYKFSKDIECMADSIKENFRNLINDVMKLDQMIQEVKEEHKEIYDDIIGGSEE